MLSYFFGNPDKAYSDWLYPQLRRPLINGQIFLLLTFTPIAWVGYYYYYADFLATLPVPEAMRFGAGDVYRMILVPLINVAIVLYIKTKSDVSTRQLEKLTMLSIFLVSSAMVCTAIMQPYYDAEFYMYEIIILILFTQILLGLGFKISVILSFLMACSAFFYLLYDDVFLKIKVYDSTIILTVWGPVLFGAFMLEQSRRLNFKIIAQLESTTKELSLKNEDLHQFAYASSHDLQEPLRSIANFVGILERQLEPKLNDEHKIFLKIIRTSTERMQNLIRAILEYSRIGRDKTLEIIRTDEILQDVLHDLSYAIQHSLAVIDAEPLPGIKAYRIEFSMLMQNLIGNALKFHKKGTPPHIKIRAIKENGHYIFSIADNGIGIEEQYLHKIFHLFGRLHSKEEYEGTGIGLTHCKKIVELHGGKLWLQSTPQIGTTFYFTIPQDIAKPVV